MEMLSGFGVVLLFMCGAVLLVGGGLLTNRILAPHRPNPEKNSTYECGEDPVGSARIQINMRFYVIALLFLVFDVEIVFLFPWAVVFGDPAFTQGDPSWALLAFTEGMVFLLILAAGLAYAWMRGEIGWVKPEPARPESPSVVPVAVYDSFDVKTGRVSLEGERRWD